MDSKTDNLHGIGNGVDARVTELRVALGMVFRRLREESSEGLTWSQGAVLSRLDREGPSTVTGLARSEGVRSQSMSATVAVLEELGLVVGSRDPGDLRRTVLWVTDAGKETLARERDARGDWLSIAMKTNLTVDEQAQLIACANLLRRLVAPNALP
ncbi:MarR family winged helix-turn-helix transcriptional regulator [Arthrobacter sp. NPDC058127]|uniref:MarR family winged helix-turn-helix transcriptional regulator n=1 Tax=Arthrobacter sp. NPDC058127 TaxID=3346351 RepID=UPI0036EA3124